MCCSGRAFAAARGTSGRALLRLEGGHLAVLQWARAQGCPWDTGVLSGGFTRPPRGAAVGAHSGLPMGQAHVRERGARGGHLAVLQWGARSGLPMGQAYVLEAADGGHLAVLQWARAQGCPWDEWTCAFAASNGHLEVLQWARAQGCPWDEHTCTFAASNGTLRCCSGCTPWAAHGTNVDNCAHLRRKGHLAVLQWARAQGCPWDELDVLRGGALRQTRGAAVGAGKRLSV